MKIAILFAAAALLAGCADHYVAPTSGATATVTFSANGMDHGAVIRVQNFDDDSCTSSKSGTRLATFTTTSIQGKGDSHDGVARPMPAGHPAVITFAYDDGSSGYMRAMCTITQSFVPVSGARYLVEFHKAGAMCGVSVTRDDGNDPKAVQGLHRITPACFNSISG